MTERRGASTTAEMVKRAGILVFGLWLVLLMLLLLAAALFEGNTSALYGHLGTLAYAALFGLFWRYRSRVIEWWPWKARTIGHFLLVGWLTALVAELLMFFTYSYQQGISLFLDIAYTTPTYVGLFVGWWIYLQRFPLSGREVFFLAGMNGLLIEGPQKLLSAQSYFNMIIAAPGHVFIYGSMMLVAVSVLGLATADPGRPVLGKYAFGLGVIPLVILPGLLASVAILAIARAG